MQPINEEKVIPHRRFLRHIRKGRLKTIAILPSLITLINGIAGFAAIGLAAKGADYYALAGYAIFIAMIADMLDGRVARMSHSTSSFGGQLDSLCDMISFGVAPAFLVLKLMMHYHVQLVGSPQSFFGGFFERSIWLACVVYLCCGAIRLARFNVENTEDETAHMSFIGLPSPAAAGILASLVVFFQHILLDAEAETLLFRSLRWTILYILPFVTVGAGILMVSRVRFPHLVNHYLRGRKPITYLAWTGVFVGIIFLFGIQLALVISFCGFASSSVVRWLWVRVMRNRLPHPQPSAVRMPEHSNPATKIE
jgi:CDP-diacylglycerol--serine O-phosphatidyltransferase